MALELDIKKLLTGDVVRLRYVPRYSNCRRNHTETVSDHSFYVVLYASVLAKWIEENHGHPCVDWKELMLKASTHDVEEARSGDFPRPFKYSHPKLRELLEEAAKHAFRHVTDGIFPGRPELLEEYWENAKDDTMEGMIVNIADFLSVVSYMYQELEAGNLGIHEHATDLEIYFGQFLGSKYQRVFGPILPGIAELVACITTATYPHRRRSSASRALESAKDDQGTDLRGMDAESRHNIYNDGGGSAPANNSSS